MSDSNAQTPRLYQLKELLPLIKELLRVVATKDQTGIMSPECDKLAEEHPWVWSYVGHTGKSDSIQALVQSGSRVTVYRLKELAAERKFRKAHNLPMKLRFQISLPAEAGLRQAREVTISFVKVSRGLYRGQG